MRIKYHFTPIPVEAMEKLERGELTAVDIALLAALLSHRQSDGTAWAAYKWLSKRIGRNVNTLQRDVKRLVKSGLVSRFRCPIPDPDHIENRTGWIWSFNFDPDSAQLTQPKKSKPAQPNENKYTIGQLREAWAAGKYSALKTVAEDINSNLVFVVQQESF